MTKSAIEWLRGLDGSLGEVWNPLTGCTREHEGGCDNCYAFTVHDQRHVAWLRGGKPGADERLQQYHQTAPAQYRLPFSKVQLLADRLSDPLHWVKPRRVFVASMGDPFHPDVPDEYIERMFGVMASTPQHTYQLLTKRPERMRDWVRSHTHQGCVAAMLAGGINLSKSQLDRVGPGWPWPLPNVWLGTSVENHAAATLRIPPLLETTAAVRFLSCEPLLEGLVLHMRRGYLYTAVYDPIRATMAQLDWVIVGGESGRRARPFQLDWARSLIGQAREVGTAIFVKQLGTYQAQANGWHDQHGGDPAEWPEDLRIREWPASRVAV